MEERPLCSVIIPTRNRAEVLRLAIESVLRQTFQDFEVIVIDDASTDDTYGVVSSYKDGRIRYVRHEERRGGSAARNTGIRIAKGEYIAFLDDDDEWLPRKLELQMHLFGNDEKTGATYTGFIVVDEYGERKTIVPTKEDGLFSNLLLSNGIGTTSTVIVHRRCFERIGTFDEELPSCQDWDMWLRISEQFSFNYVEEPTVIYKKNNASISSDLESVIRGRKMLLEKIKSNYHVGRHIVGHHYFIVGCACCREGKTKEGRRLIWKAILLSPLKMQYYLYFICSLLGNKAYKHIGNMKRKINRTR